MSEKIVESSHYQTANRVKHLPVLLSIGDTTFLDYKKIKIKREEYGPIGNGGNGLILHSSLAVDPNSGQPLGLCNRPRALHNHRSLSVHRRSW